MFLSVLVKSADLDYEDHSMKKVSKTQGNVRVPEWVSEYFYFPDTFLGSLGLVSTCWGLLWLADTVSTEPFQGVPHVLGVKGAWVSDLPLSGSQKAPHSRSRFFVLLFTFYFYFFKHVVMIAPAGVSRQARLMPAMIDEERLLHLDASRLLLRRSSFLSNTCGNRKRG